MKNRRGQAQSVAPQTEIEIVAVRVGQRCIADLRKLEFLHNRCTQHDQALGLTIEVGGLQVEMHTVAVRGYIFSFLELEMWNVRRASQLNERTVVVGNGDPKSL